MFSATLIVGNVQCYVILVGFYFVFMFCWYKLHAYNLTIDLSPQHYFFFNNPSYFEELKFLQEHRGYIQKHLNLLFSCLKLA